ncbi:MAG: DUF177 domain-containing protein [Gammaproteobacteria bacterium]
MINHLPDRLDLYAAAEAGRVLRGRVELARLVRALPQLESPEGELEVLLELGRDEDGTHNLAGTVQGKLVLLCQRCLEPMEYPLDVTFRLGLVHSQEQIQGLSDRYEPLLITGEPASLAEILTDEVLLALPIVPLHSGVSTCRPPAMDYQTPANSQRENPFAVLAQLKQKP